ncbi:MAG: response regulator [Spirochaetaceae bacterium]
MITKKITLLLLLLILTFFSVFSETSHFPFDLNNWDSKETYTNQTFNLGIIQRHNKHILQKSFTMPNNINDKIIYLNIKNHTGFSKIYFNNHLLSTIGSISNIKEGHLEYYQGIVLPITTKKNSIKIINYSIINTFNTEYSLNPKIQPSIISRFYTKITKVIPIAFAIITLLVIFTFFFFKTVEDGKGISYVISLTLFLIYFLISAISPHDVLSKQLSFVAPPLYGLAWLIFILFYNKKYDIWDIKKTSIATFSILSLFLSVFIIYHYNIIFLDIRVVYNIYYLILITVLMILTFKGPKPNEKQFRIGLIVSITIHSINTILLIFFSFPTYGILEMGTLVFIISYDFSFLTAMVTKINSSENYTQKLLDTIEKSKIEIDKKDNKIADLKTTNGEILREKSLFFSTLSSNLRAPLNSIIGYGENLYSTDNIDGVHELVSGIILESDKIFQAINNVTDFSVKDFTNNDLQLKDFRMKEIYENSVYDSPIISAYKNRINYKSLDNTDKILICGNPNIYKQILTSFFNYLITKSPESIDYSISHSEIIGDYMELNVSLKANNLKETEISIISPKEKYREIFIKYIKLYNIGFEEELKDSNYYINIKFECGVSKSQSISKRVQEIPSNIMLSKNITVLVVEDYIPNLKIVEMHLTKMGCNVLTATDGEQSISIFNNNIVDVVLMDIKMPIMDGWEATEKIRSTEKGLDTLIIGLTASSLDLDIRHCFESGMDDVQVKPIRKNQLYNKLRALETFEPLVFPTPSQLRADYGLSKVETDKLFTSSIKQIEKQIEVMEMLASAGDDGGLDKERPSIINAAVSINAFYFVRLLRNYFNAYENKEPIRQNDILIRLKAIIKEIIQTNVTLFRD